MKAMGKWLGLPLLLMLIVISVGVEIEVSSPAVIRGPERGPHAVVIHHPNVFDDFIGEMSNVFADELVGSGWRVTHELAADREMSSIEDASLVVFGANTFWFHPDFPTLNTIERNAAALKGKRVVALIGGAGATARSERVLAERIQKTGAQLVATRSLWIFRPNDEGRMDDPNRQVARDLVRSLARTQTSTVGS